MRFARKCQKILKERPNFFKEDILMYLDGVSFVFKNNPFGEAMRPKARVWRNNTYNINIKFKYINL